MTQYQPMYDSFNRTPERYVPTARMSVSANVVLPGSEIDMRTGQLKPDRVRRHRTQAEKIEHNQHDRTEKETVAAVKRETAKGGIRLEMWRGVLIVSALMFVCCMYLLWQQGKIAQLQKDINQQERIMSQYRKQNAELESQIAAASDPAVILYAASRELHMIPAESAEAIHLVAVDTRPLETARKQKQQMMAAQTMELQNTPVPMTASN